MNWQLFGGPADGHEISIPDHISPHEFRMPVEEPPPTEPITLNEFSVLPRRRFHFYKPSSAGRLIYHHTTP